MLKIDSEYAFTTIETHTLGEPTRIIISGFPKCNGSSMMEKKQFLQANYDHLRSALMCEPRGHKDMVGALILPKSNEETDFGVVFMDANRWINMCGHASIGCATFAIANNMVSVKEPATIVKIDTPVGIVQTIVKVEKGVPVEVTLTNVPSFLYQDNIDVELDGITYQIAISFGGTFFALIDAQQLHIDLETKDIQFLIDFTKRILKRINEQMKVKHPYLNIERVVNAEYYLSINHHCQKNIVISEEGQVDRSPCGTGTSAKLAYLYSKELIKANEVYINRSFTGASFKGMFKEEVNIDTFNGIIPLISGSAYISGEATYYIDKNDPMKYGFHI